TAPAVPVTQAEAAAAGDAAGPGPASPGANAPPGLPVAAAEPGGEGAEPSAEETSEGPADDGMEPQEWDGWSWEEQGLEARTRRLLGHMLGRKSDTIDNLTRTIWGTDEVILGAVRSGTSVRAPSQGGYRAGHWR